MPTEEETTIHIHGPHCPKWLNPRTTDDFLALQLVMQQTTEHRTDFICPACNESVGFMYDYGELDFGV